MNTNEQTTTSATMVEWLAVALKCKYRVRIVPRDLYAQTESTCSHGKRIGKRCAMVVCPLGKFNDEKFKDQIKSIWE